MKKGIKLIALCMLFGILAGAFMGCQPTDPASDAVKDANGTTTAPAGAATSTPEATTPAETASAPAETASEAPEATPAATIAGERLDKILAAGKIVMGTEGTYPPYEFHIMKDGVDTLVGFDVAIAQEIADKLGVKLEIVDMDFDGLLVALQAGEIDMVLAAMTPSQERKQSVDFSGIYYKAKQVVVVRKDDVDKFTDIASLSGKTVGAQKGAIQAGIVEEQMKESKPLFLPKIPTLLMELISGNCDAVVVEGPVADQMVKQRPEVVISKVEVADPDGGSAVAICKDSPMLLAKIQEVLDEIATNGKLDQFVVDAITLQGELE